MTLITFEHARKIIESQSKRGLDKKKLANNTYLMKSDCFVIQLHNTNIIKIYPNDIYELNTEGWQTVTTKDRLNEFSPADIYQKRGVWFVKDNNADKEDKVFFDGIRISKSGEILNSDSAPDNLIERKKRLDRMVSSQQFIMFTQEDYKSNKCSLSEFLDQFIDDTTVEIVRVGIGQRVIEKSKDKNFNDIDLRSWDLIAPAVQRHVQKKAKALGVIISISFLISVSKRAAEQIKFRKILSA
jgi:hypothetical protein